jgi:hypothetical protein
MVLNMLRWELGDSIFFQSIKNYLTDSTLINNFAKTDDVKRHFETTADTNLTQFFNNWIYKEGFPIYEVNWSQNDENIVSLNIKQTQSDPSVIFFELDLPIFFRKIPITQKLNLLEKYIIVATPGSRVPDLEFQNCVLVKIPFFVREGDDWITQTLPSTILRFKKIWANFARSGLAEKFFVLDSRLFTKRYGQDLIDAIPQKFEGVKISL